MSDANSSYEGRYFYRRVAPHQWVSNVEGFPPRPVADLFELSLADTDGLSVFDTAKISPRAVLQETLNTFLRFIEEGEKKKRIWAERKLMEYGPTVENMLAKGWGIVVLAEDDFTQLGLMPMIEAEINGHLTIRGSEEKFIKASVKLANAARTVNLKEY